ncbi:MAG TPA: hypothetical protein VF544_21920 [Pyrinomonadaceae bacterium]|jgi:hypothetical protein
MLQAVALLIILPLLAFCWLRVLNKGFRRRYRPWWLKLAAEREEDAADYDTLEAALAWVAALIITSIFVYTAGVGFLWK